MLNLLKSSLAVSFITILAISSHGQNAYVSGSEILKGIERLQTTACVLYVAAHPDDENTRLLAYLANEKKYRTVYVYLTRGDGGQNMIGEEKGDAVGIIRTRELMAARSVDGAEQTFGDCHDFGYSKSPEETFKFWNKEKALAHLVWTIRKYRPDVIINRFPTTGEGGHGHHTASAILALEAFKAAADPTKFKDQLTFVNIWQAKRIFLNSFNSRNQPQNSFEGQLKLDVGGFDVHTGRSHGETASESRSMHKSQGFGVARQRGALIEYFKKLDGDTAVNEVFEGIPESWDRISGGSKIKFAIEKIKKEFDVNQPSKSLPALVKLLAMIRTSSDNYWKEVKEQELVDIIKNCAGLFFEASTNGYKATPGDTIGVNFNILSRTSDALKLVSIRCHGFDTVPVKTLERNTMFSFKKTIKLDPNSAYSNVYWLDKGYGNPIQWPNSGLAWGNDLMEAHFSFELFGEKISIKSPFSHKWVDPVKGECIRPFEVVPKISIEPESTVGLSINGAPATVRFSVVSESDTVIGFLKPIPPSGWKSIPDSVEIKIKEKGKPIWTTFTLYPPAPSDMAVASDLNLKMHFITNGKSYSQQVKRIIHEHIPHVVYLEETHCKIVPVAFETKARKIGYIEGAGDEVDACLRLAGFDVEMLDAKKILLGDLSTYDAIITGVRAYNTNDEIGSWQEPLMRYVEQGGTMLVQYNTNNFLGTVKAQVGPYRFKITRDRVTEENANPNFSDANHPVLNTPNKISLKDFDGWVQERGLYFAGEVASEYTKPISWNDSGEKPMDGSLIVAKKGKGTFIYTGISFFRQLPAGVPGAYRLLINLLNAK
ncbi:MAG: PIG-L family deacetylase [Bacteroidota bacterium]